MSASSVLLSVKETLEIMSVLKENIEMRPSVNKPHKIMVWFPEAANRHLGANVPKDAYFLRVLLAVDSSEKSRPFVEERWDEGFVTIEIVRNNDICVGYKLPRDAVMARNIDETIIEPIMIKDDEQ